MSMVLQEKHRVLDGTFDKSYVREWVEYTLGDKLPDPKTVAGSTWFPSREFESFDAARAYLRENGTHGAVALKVHDNGRDYWLVSLVYYA